MNASKDAGELLKNSLKALIEEILFNPTELEKMKVAISDLSLGRIEAKQVRRVITNFLQEARDELLANYSFFAQYSSNVIELNAFGNEAPDATISRLQKDIDERNELLTLLGNEITLIYEKLTKKRKARAEL